MLLVTKHGLGEGSTSWAQGGIAAAIGVTYEQLTGDLAAVMAQADAALYQAKTQGRNCAVLASL